ncbi:hypothetical protein I7I49_06685 [Sinorhizobium meliloti]|uniref:hypothetical protein n=1 Tax=Rhizobium meliloti TaxID=382 RepID=UPI00237F93CB|nr:hypothetical protein [Sinorhizobium meliloti]MDE3809965.1 hypothetical protein [Sinorhizobium meliloti]
MSEPTNEVDIEAALAQFMAEEKIDREEAMRVILRDWLIGRGYLPFAEDDTVEGGGDPFGI